MTEEQIRERLRLEVEQESQTKVAKRLGFAQPYIGRVVAGAPVSDRLAAAMGFRRVTRFERIDG